MAQRTAQQTCDADATLVLLDFARQSSPRAGSNRGQARARRACSAVAPGAEHVLNFTPPDRRQPDCRARAVPSRCICRAAFVGGLATASGCGMNGRMRRRRHLRAVSTSSPTRSGGVPPVRQGLRTWIAFVPVWGAAALLGTAYGAGWLDLRGSATAEAAAGESVAADFSMCHTGGGHNCVVDGDTIWLGGTNGYAPRTTSGLVN